MLLTVPPTGVIGTVRRPFFVLLAFAPNDGIRRSGLAVPLSTPVATPALDVSVSVALFAPAVCGTNLARSLHVSLAFSVAPTAQSVGRPLTRRNSELLGPLRPMSVSVT